MILLLDIGNTNTHVGLANARRVLRVKAIPTSAWFNGTAQVQLAHFAGVTTVHGAAMCSVVPRVTATAGRVIYRIWKLPCLQLTAKNLRGVGLDYPEPETIGPDRLANAIAARHFFGAPVVAVDFGTATTFDVVDRHGNFVGGVIAPGLTAMTDYLHEKTVRLPRIRVQDITSVIGKGTEHAMQAGAVFGYRGLVRGVLAELRRELRAPRLTVVATGGCARLIASELPEICAIQPKLTLEGLRLFWVAHQS